nr:hypothetical protein [Tanacetum cinerariifolium]
MSGAHPSVVNPNFKHLKNVSIAIFITNFPTAVSSKDLWKLYDRHGVVADVYIARKLSKSGRRFGFVRFIKSPDQATLLEDLNEIWIGSYHLFAAVARSERNRNTQLTQHNQVQPNHTKPQHTNHSSQAMGARSFASILSGKIGSQKEVLAGTITKSITLENSDSLELSDISNVVLAKVKDVHLIINIHSVLKKEGFSDFKCRYMGGLWLWIESSDDESRLKFQKKKEMERYFTQRNPNLYDDVEKDIEDCRVRPVKAAVKDSSIVSPSTPPATDLNPDEESCSTWHDSVGPLITNELDSEKRWNYRDPDGNVQGPFSLAQLHLWKVCSGYSTVVDVFIPNKRSKTGKHFAFVRFIKVLNFDQLIENLKTIWIGRFHISANPARFERPKAPIPQKQMSTPSGLWVMIELNSSKSKSKFMEHVGVASWFRNLCNEQPDFAAKEQIVWVDIEGFPLNAWSRSTFQKIGSKWGELVDLEDMYEDLFARKRICVMTSHTENILESFKHIVKGKVFWARAKELFVWSPSFKEVPDREIFSDDESIKTNEDANNLNLGDAENDSEVVSDTYFAYNGEDQGVDQHQAEPSKVQEVSDDPFNIYGLLNKCNKEVRTSDSSSSISYPPGFTPINDIPTGIQDNPVVSSARSPIKSARRNSSPCQSNGLSSRVMEDTVPANVYTSSVGSKSKHGSYKGGSMLEVLDGMIKVGQAMGFSMDGCLKDMKIMIGSQGACLLSRWKGEVLVTGDFNEVRFERERLGSVFNVREANEFNSFISNARLVEIQLEALCLDKNLDHRPILLRELVTDYDATPFRLYHSWFYFHGFDDMKAKIQWAVEGDENSKFFHGVVNRKRVQLSVKGVMIDGEWVDEPDRVKAEFRSHFANRFQDKGLSRCRLNFRFPSLLSADQISDLEKPMSYDEVRKAVWSCVEWFFMHNSFAKGCNASFITLIPKKQDPKITAFLPNRQILDGPFIISELLSWCRHKKQQAMVFKVDFAKAYDSVRWDYLDDVLSSFGFGVKWRSWIKGSLTSGMASVLVNGSPTSEFQFHCGLKQRDPLAPYLFILVMKSLHLSVSRAVEAGNLFGIKIDPAISISHLFYVDDAIFVGVGVNDSLVNEGAGSISCSVMKAPFKYLGIMVGSSMSKISAWDEMVGKIKSRLSKWKVNTLSIGGRLTLLKAVLGSTPIYPMSLYNVPKSVLHEMESLRHNFFNGAQRVDRKISWVKWSKVLASKKFGGLGVSSFFALNRVLLFRWVWRFLSHDNSLWFRFISAMHDSSIQSRSSSHCSNWLSILREVSALKLQDARDLVDEVLLPKENVATRWIKAIPIKVNVFAWKLRLDRLPTRSNLFKRGVQVQSSLCPLYNTLQEDTSHLFFSCNVALAISRRICRWWNVSWGPSDSYLGWLEWFTSIRMGHKLKGILEGVFMCLCGAYGIS